jgi:hypothetical protein
MDDPIQRRLKDLASELDIRSADKLRRAAVQRGMRVSLAECGDALKQDVAKQVLAPAQRAIGQSASEGVGRRFQADLMDFSKNTSTTANGGYRYVLQLIDVFSRRVATAPLLSKNKLDVKRALNKLLRELGAVKECKVTTDDGAEFAGYEVPKDGVHVVKDPADRNALAVNDKAMQTLKQKLATSVARHGGAWTTALRRATAAMNNTHNTAVHGTAAGAAKEDSVQHFLVEQDNASKFAHNNEIYKERATALEAKGGFRAPIPNSGRSFKPRYGPVHEVAEVMPGKLQVKDAEGNTYSTKHVLAVDKASGEPQGKLTFAAAPPKRDPGKEVLRPVAVEIANYLRENGAQDIADLEERFQARLKDVNIKVVLSIFKTLFKFDATTQLWSAAPQKAVSTGQFKRLTRLNRKTPASSSGAQAVPVEQVPAAAAAFGCDGSRGISGLAMCQLNEESPAVIALALSVAAGLALKSASGLRMSGRGRKRAADSG